MSGDPLPPDLDPPVLRASLSELGRGLDSLRERLTRLERSAGQAASSASEPGADRLDPGRHALGIFQELLSIPSSGVQPGELFALAVDRAARLLAADRAMLFVAESRSGRLVARSGRGFRRNDLESISIGPGEGFVGRVFAEKRVLVSGGDAGPAGGDPFLEAFPVTEAIAVPVRAEGEVAGVLYAGRRGFGAPFGTSDILLLLVIADRVGTGLVHEGLLDRRGADVARLREIEGLAEAALVGDDPGGVLARACEAACRLVGVRAGAIALGAEPEDLTLEASCGLAGIAGRRVSPREGLTAELYASRGPVACRDLGSRRVPEADFLAGGEWQSCLLVPLRFRGRVLGVLYLADSEAREFSAEQVAAAQALGTLAAATVENARLYGELRSAFEDALAGRERLVESAKARALGEMAGGLAREFNNIFAIILGKTQLLLARTHDDPLREGLGMLEEAAWRGADIVHRLLGLAATAMEDAAGPVDMAALVQDAVALTRARWKDEPEARGVRIEVSAELESAPPVGGNPTALREAVMSLLVNAVDAMPQGGRLRVRTRPRDGGVELAVEDTGEGIPDDVRRRIFAPFFTTRSPLRLGLGLAVAQGVVAHYGGRIGVASSPGQGTSVTVWLPAAAPPPAAAEARTPAAGEPAAPVAGVETPAAQPEPEREEPRATAAILVLEEEGQTRSMLVDALSQAGHKVEAAAEGLEGLARIESGRFDVVLTALSLPQHSGLEIARAVKRASPETAVVLLTGWGHGLDAARLRESGVDFMLVKPFGLDRMLSVVGEAFRLRSSA